MANSGANEITKRWDKKKDFGIRPRSPNTVLRFETRHSVSSELLLATLSHDVADERVLIPGNVVADIHLVCP